MLLGVKKIGLSQLGIRRGSLEEKKDNTVKIKSW